MVTWEQRLEVVDHPAEEHHRDGEEGQEGPHQVHLQAQEDHGPWNQNGLHICEGS